ncbi:MAG TPA: hypothetical protein VFH47_00740, partial [Candidatus Thermoplasmatota archaeon]|nr:hypothetical protein [Candidatus Thermoplasmatota archaeon]
LEELDEADNTATVAFTVPGLPAPPLPQPPPPPSPDPPVANAGGQDIAAPPMLWLAVLLALAAAFRPRRR